MNKKRKTACKWLLALWVFLVVAGVIIGLVVGLSDRQGSPRTVKEEKTTQMPEEESTHASTTPSEEKQLSKQGKYRFAGVSTPNEICSQIGTEILARSCGSAVDAAIAAVLCLGVVSGHSCGIGGGHFMTVYLRENQTVVSVNAREMAPGASTVDMFLQPNASSQLGGLSAGVPGEIMGFYQAHRRYGSLPWRELFKPAIRLGMEGFPLNHHAVFSINRPEVKPYLDHYPNLRQLVTNPSTGEYYKEGEIMKRPKLARTLEIISQEGPEAFYTGSLVKDIVDDIKETGGIITAEDLSNYTAPVQESLIYTTQEGVRIFTPRPPSGGLVLTYILNILDGYNFTISDVATTEGKILTYHRVIEAFKFAFAKRTGVADEVYVPDVEELIVNMTSHEFGESIRMKISDDVTYNTSYYEPTFYDDTDHGTAHVSVLAPNGDAVAITATVNLPFGSKAVGSRTGIVFNNEMDDFSTPNTTNFFGIPASPANFIQPGKRPLSSMSPTIIVDNNGDVILTLGASGGTRITTTIAWVALKTVFFGQDPKTATDSPRLHHQLIPGYIKYDEGLDQAIVDGLKAKGHDMRPLGVESNSDAVMKSGNDILACSDYHKGGSPDGY